jgi:imidazolonepropionase-like amidohydrolase
MLLGKPEKGGSLMPSEDLLIAGARLIELGEGPVSELVSIAVQEGRITDVRPSTFEDSGRADIDLEGRYVIPGLVDLHVHLCHEPRTHFGIGFSHGEPEQVAAYRVIQNLTEMQQHGVCLVRDVGGREGPIRQVADLAARREMVLPDIESAGAPYCLESGHGIEFGRSLNDDTNIPSIMGDHAAEGHSWIKVMNGPEIWPRRALSRLCDAARRAGLKVAVHAFTDEGVWSALDARVDTIEHCFASSEEMVVAATESGTNFVPTAFAARVSLGTSFRATMPPDEVGYLMEWQGYLDEGLAVHRRSCLPALIGTDAGCAPCQAQDIIDEMLQLESWSFSPADILKWATRTAADILGRADFGRIARGRWASLLAVDENPLDSIRNLRDPALVLIKGAPVRDRVGLNVA